jgi:PBSX family phage terminase large subunit
LQISLNDCFPEPPNGGVRGPLPRQQEFLNLALSSGTPKYIRYCGGIGSGKTLIGCITVLCWALLHPGTYLVSRQFMPELRITTLQTFLDICPPELIAEYRVADAVVKIKSQGGKLSTIIFRGLDEPDKLRSLNLSGFYIDEGNQVSKEAFVLLQGRLRGPGLRKGILTQNSGGHDWSWQWFVKKDMMKTEEIKREFVNIYAPSTENVHLPEGYVASMLQTWSEERIAREIHANEDQFEGQVYTEFRQDVHVIPPFAIPEKWTRVIGIDHGFRNPACWLWGAVDYDGNIYIYREFYEREWLIEEICKGKKKEKKPGVIQMMQIPGTRPAQFERIDWARIDPSTKARRNEREGVKLSDYDLYTENLPDSFPLMNANNDVTAGIDKVKTYFKPDSVTGKPRLYIFSTCKELIEEIGKYRYPELTSSQQGKRAEKENPLKVDDHAMDALRYLVMGLPDVPVHVRDPYEKIAYNSLEGQLMRDLEEMRAPSAGKDPFGL